MRIGLYSHNIDFAGTWRSHERIAEILQHNDEYEIYNNDNDNYNLNLLRYEF
jgi:hypothetical protein